MKQLKSGRLTVLLAIAVLLGNVMACASTRSAGEQLDDAAISSKIEAKLLADPEINSFKIDVDTQEGVVRLSGTVEKEATRAEAEKHARSTRGVVRVVNDLQVGTSSLGERIADRVITTKIKAKLTSDPQVNPFNIDVDTQGGIVTLRGRVAHATARLEAEKLAWSTNGVRTVHNRIAVAPRTS